MERKTFNFFSKIVSPMFATHKFNSGVRNSWPNGKSYKQKNKERESKSNLEILIKLDAEDTKLYSFPFLLIFITI